MSIDKPDVRVLNKISKESAEEYINSRGAMVKKVNEVVINSPLFIKLAGENKEDTASNNHDNHFLFMSNVFKLNDFNLLLNTLPWVYHSYHSHGFSYEYFTLVIESFQKAVEELLSESSAREINSIYYWMKENHENWIELSLERKNDDFDQNDSLTPVKEKLYNMMIEGKVADSCAFAKKFINDGADISTFYLKVMEPVLSKIGDMWEEDKLSVADEHLASSIATRILLSTYELMEIPYKRKASVIATAAPNELHCLGNWMLSDILETKGWRVKNLGANTPVEDLITMLKKEKPLILFISVTMPFNLEGVKTVINRVKEHEELKDVKTIVGGRLFREVKNLCKTIGADYCTFDILKAVEKAEEYLKA